MQTSKSVALPPPEFSFIVLERALDRFVFEH